VEEVEFIQVSSTKKQRISKQVEVARNTSSRIAGTGYGILENPAGTCPRPEDWARLSFVLQRR
jgi:hypothetical protein